MLGKFYSALKNFFKDEDEQHVVENFKAKLDPPTRELLTIYYQNKEGYKTVVEIYTAPNHKYDLVVDGTEEHELSFYKLVERLREIEEKAKPRKISYIYSILPFCMSFSFLFYVRKERLKKKVIKTFRCRNVDVYVVVRRTEKANIMHAELIVGDTLAMEGYIPTLFLKHLRKLEEFFEIFCELEEVKPC
jgi:hypothetical protein